MNHHSRKRHHGKPNNRGRHNGHQSSVLSINKVYDSNGPAGKVRGTAQVIYEKYQSLARDAQSADDRILAENFLQHAEHYLRILHAIQEQMQGSYDARYSSSPAMDENSEESAGAESFEDTHSAKEDSASYGDSAGRDSFGREQNNRDNNRRVRSLYGQRRTEYARPSHRQGDSAEMPVPEDTSEVVTENRFPRRTPHDPLKNRRRNYNQNPNANDEQAAFAPVVADTPTAPTAEDMPRRRGVVRRRVPARVESEDTTLSADKE